MRKVFLLLSAAAISLLCDRFHFPAAWFFGPLMAAAVFALRDWEVLSISRKSSIAAQSVIGAAMGASFSPTTLCAIPGHLIVIGVAIFSILFVCLFNGWLLTRWTRLDPITAFLGTLPGGAGEMAAMSDSLRADTRLVVVMQYARLLMILVVLFIAMAFLNHKVVHPVSAGALMPDKTNNGLQYVLLTLLTIAGYFAGTRTRIPAGAFLIPSLLYLALVLAGIQPGHWPLPLLAAAYAVMGLRIGAQFNPSTIAAIKSLILPLVGTSIVLLLGAVGLAQWFGHEMHLDIVSAYLAATPGGLDSVAAVATELQANSAIILTIHLVRLMSVLLIGPWLVVGGSRWMRRSAPEA
jgi:membrane AbrB-like protein